MLKLKLSKQADNFLSKIPAKHAKQIAERISLLRQDPFAVISEELKGYAPYRRFKSGEYRVIFFIEMSTETLHVTIVGKRNDDEVYELLKRFMR